MLVRRMSPGGIDGAAPPDLLSCG